jgi:hypothetical protein
MTDTLDFPTIDDAALAAAPPAPKNQVAAAAAAAAVAVDIDKIDLLTLALAKFNPSRKQLADATKTLTGAVHDLSTQSKIDDAKSLRQRLINAPLADARKVSKGLKSKLKSVSDDVGAELETIETGFAEASKLITPQIEAREAELAEEKRIAEAKAAARRQEFEDKISIIRGYLASAQGLPSARIEKGIAFVAAMPFGDEWAEFKAIAEKARDETLASLRELLAKTQAEEVAAAERERVRLENERVAAELAEQKRQLEEQRAEMQRQMDAQRAELQRLRDEAEALAAAQQAEVLLKTQPQPVDDLEKEKIEPLAPEPVASVPAPAAATWKPKFDGGSIVSAEPAPVAVESQAQIVDAPADVGATIVQPAAAPAPIIDVVAAEPDDDTVLTDLQALLAHIHSAFDTKFPTQPKPSIEWWAELRRLADEVSA